MNFEFFNPVHIIFGAGEVRRAGGEARKLGSKALLVSYSEHSFMDDLLSTVQGSLRDAGVEVVPFFGVSTNPKMREVAQGVALAQSAGVDLVIGLGGGSPMDAAKLIAAGVLYEGDLWNMVFSRHDGTQAVAPPQRALPLMMIPTVPATGSEMNPTAVVTNEATSEKSYTWAPCLYPRVSIVDPALTCSLPPYVTACSAADTIAHVLEFYLTGYEDAPLNNRIQEGVMLTVIEQVPKVLAAPTDVTARGHLQWASIIALNGIAQPGDGWTPMHQLGHVLSARFDVAHGASLTVVMPAWMKHFYPTRLGQYAQLAERIFGVRRDGRSDEEVALEGIARFEAFLDRIGAPICLADVGIGAETIPTLTADVVRVSFGPDGLLRSRPPATRADVEAVFRLSLERA
ncbi:MAG: iron-containing alcohol dehydrogenase [Chloroflexota bacterium]|jgi:alcohol dehydrogenase YqhD (iron-dependent ADH family)